MKKDAKIYFVSTSTRMHPIKVGRHYCLAFDTIPKSRAKMIGIGVDDANVAKALSSYFAQMGEALSNIDKPKDGE